MNFLIGIFRKELTKKVFIIFIIFLVVYSLRRIMDIFLLTFLFTYLIYSVQLIIVNRLSCFFMINQAIVIIILYSIIFMALGYFFYKYTPILVSQSLSIINGFIDEGSEYNISKLEKILYPMLGNIDIEAYIKSETNSIFKFVSDIGKWTLNIFLALILSFFFMLEKEKIKCFLLSFDKGSDSSFIKYIKLFGTDFLNSFGKVVQAQVFIAITNTILSIIVLSLLEFPQLLALVFIIFMFSLIPIAGTVMSLIPISVIAFNIGGIIKVLYVLAMIALLHALESYVINPQLMSAKTQLPVFIVFVILIISQHFMGVWGVLIGIPLFMFVLDLLNVKLNEK